MFIDAISSKNIQNLKKIYGTLGKSGLKGLNAIELNLHTSQAVVNRSNEKY